MQVAQVAMCECVAMRYALISDSGLCLMKRISIYVCVNPPRSRVP